MRIAVLSLGLIAAVGSARADEEKVAFEKVPKAVQAAVKARFPEAKVTEAAREVEDGKTVYEIGLEDEHQKVDVLVSTKGKILEVEKTISPKKLPKAVAATIKAEYPRAAIKKAERIVKREDGEKVKLFEVILATEGKDDVEVKLSPAGQVLEGDEDEDDKDSTVKEDEDGDKKAKTRKDKDGEDDDDKKVKAKKDGDKKVKTGKDKDDDDEGDDDDHAKEKGKKDKD